MTMTANQQSVPESPSSLRTAIAVLALLLFAPPLSRWLGIVLLPRELSLPFYYYQMPLLESAFILLMLKMNGTRSLMTGNAATQVHPLAIVLVLGIVSAVFSALPVFAVLGQAKWIVWLGFILALLSFVNRNEKRAGMVLDIYLGGFLFYAFIVHVMVFSIDEPDFYWMHQMPGFGNIRMFGQFAMAAVVISYRPWLDGGPDITRAAFWRAFLPMALAWTMVLWAGGRAPLIALAGTLVVLTAAGYLRRPGRVALVTLGAVATAILWSTLIGVGEIDAGLTRMVGTLSREGAEAVTSGRASLWTATAAMIADAPLAGFGAGTFSFVIPGDAGLFYHPHNLPLQAMFDWGVVIGGLFLGALGWLAWGMFRAPKRCEAGQRLPDHVAIGFALLLVMLIAGLVDGTFFHPEPMLMAGVGIALGLNECAVVRPSAAARLTVLMTVIFVAATMVVGAGAALFAVGSPRNAPAFDSLQAKAVRLLPVSLYEASGLYTHGRWIDQWADDLSPEALDAELSFLRRYSRWKVSAQLVDVRAACAAGLSDTADQILDELDASIHGFVRREAAYLRGALREEWRTCPPRAAR